MRAGWAATAAIWAAVLAAGVLAGSDATADDRTGYSLFNPKPDDQRRDMTTDRPDTTESPFTVDPGRFQVETTLFGYARSRRDSSGTRTQTYEFATTNLRIGLTESLELDLGWQPYGIVRSRAPAARERDSGMGGMDIRLKANLWGNGAMDEPGATALGVLPFITLPTDRRNGIGPEHVEGGLILPFAVTLPADFGLGLNAGVVSTRADGDRRAEGLASASLSYAWNDRIGTYYEIAARFNTADGSIVLLATGATYKLTDSLQLDAGLNIGVTSASDRINPFIGISARF